MSNNNSNNNNNNNNEARRPKVVEDGPTFHSVALMPAMSAPAFPLRSVAPPMPAKQTPRSSARIYPGFTIDLKPQIESAPWKVTNALAIPSYHILERTHAYVSGATSEEVSARIADFCRAESIAATFDNKQCIARAETQGCLKFAVRIWKAKEQVVVEVQRTAGCCFLYHETAKAVLRAAKSGVGESSSPVLSTRKSLPMPKSIPQIPESAWEECTIEDLESACDSLKPGNRFDAHMLAAESLVQLSEASKCRVFCAKKILNPNSQLLSTLLSLVQCSRMNAQESRPEDEMSSMEQTHFQLMHRHALTILANCLCAVRESGELRAFLADLPELTSDITVMALVDDLSWSKTKPHDAAAACRCLQALCSSSDECKNTLVRLGGKPVVSTAKQQCRHALLEAEAAKLMQDL